MQGIGDYAIRSLQLAALLLCLTLSAQKAPVRAGTTQPHQVALRHPGTPSDLVERTGFRLLRPPLTPACRPVALGKNVVLEFRFDSDDISEPTQAGWYIDDVVVTTPAP